VDASAALKWVIEESGSEAALKLLEGEALFAPDFLLVEVANVLWSKGRRGVLTREQVEIAYEAVASAPLVLVPLGELIPAARTLAFALDVTVYDALYAALADAVTVYPFTGGGQINVNTAPEGVLRSIRYRENQATASPEPLSDDSIERILEARQAGLAIASKMEFLELLGLEPTSAITPDLVFASNFFMIRAAGRVDESTARLEVVVERGEGPPRVLYWRSE
ncbi:MAG: PIN domain-containing protein, partial [Myxococcota bacterium]